MEPTPQIVEIDDGEITLQNAARNDNPVAQTLNNTIAARDDGLSPLQRRDLFRNFNSTTQLEGSERPDNGTGPENTNQPSETQAETHQTLPNEPTNTSNRQDISTPQATEATRSPSKRTPRAKNLAESFRQQEKCFLMDTTVMGDLALPLS